MRLFFRFVVIYLGAALVFAATVRHQPVDDVVLEAVVTTYARGKAMGVALLTIAPVLLAASLAIGWRCLGTGAGVLGQALAASVLLQTAFSFVKLTIPLAVPFYADPALAEADRWLHGGVDAWELAHRVGAWLPVDALLPAYTVVWGVPALVFAPLLAVGDADENRRARFLVLYLFAWIVLGNLLALAGSSAGPVFHDALVGGDRFAGLGAALAESGVSSGHVGYIQNLLWLSYAEQGMAIGSGMSAFPSVHVAVATLIALYLVERGRPAGVAGFAFLAIVQFLSVYTGYHYAIDGYVSILLMCVAWALLRRVDLTSTRRLGFRRGSAAATAGQG